MELAVITSTLLAPEQTITIFLNILVSLQFIMDVGDYFAPVVVKTTMIIRRITATMLHHSRKKNLSLGSPT